jgi:hypothetical protein
MGAWCEVIRGQYEPIKKKYQVRRLIRPIVQTDASFKKKSRFFSWGSVFFLTGPLMGARVELLSVGHTRARLTPWPVAPMLKPETFQRNRNLDEFSDQFRNNFHHPTYMPMFSHGKKHFRKLALRLMVGRFIEELE